VASWFTQCTAYGAKILPKTQAERDLLDLKGKFGRSSAERWTSCAAARLMDGRPCWTTEPPPPPSATCIADFELARAGRPKFSKGRATPAGYARMLACARIARALRAHPGILVLQYHSLIVWVGV